MFWLPKIWFDTKMYFPNMPGRALKVCGGAVKDYMVLKGTLVSALSFAQTEQYVLAH